MRHVMLTSSNRRPTPRASKSDAPIRGINPLEPHQWQGAGRRPARRKGERLTGLESPASLRTYRAASASLNLILIIVVGAIPNKLTPVGLLI